MTDPATLHDRPRILRTTQTNAERITFLAARGSRAIRFRNPKVQEEIGSALERILGAAVGQASEEN